MPNKRGEIVIDFSLVSGGVNTTDPGHAVRQNQCQLSYNTRFKQKGWLRAPGFAGLSATPPFAAYIKLLDVYFRTNGTDKLLGVSNGKLYEINKTTNAATERYDITGTGEAWGASFQDKHFVANGTDVVKLENETAYKVGIAAPTGASAAAAAGGTLPDGDYIVYISYARSTNLYSVGQSLGTITLGGGNNTIAITSFANSSDAQVTDKVVWCSDAGGSQIYYYGHTGDNTTTSINIASNANRDVSKNYRILGEPSSRPGALQGIHFHNNRAYGWINNTLYASLPATTIYDVERWPTIYYTFPFKILSIFSIGDHLYLNTNRGVYRLPYGDMASRYVTVSKTWYFKEPRTVAYMSDGEAVIGLTNDGVRIFDGNKFTIDISKDIKPEISKLYSGTSSAFKPCGVVYTRNDRTEYRMSYRNLDVGSACHNRQLVLNLDTLAIVSNTEYNAAWEIWDRGFGYAAIDGEGNLYMGQTINGNSQIMKEQASTITTDINIINAAGTLLDTATNKKLYVKSRIEIPDMAGRIDWDTLRVFSLQNVDATVKIRGVDNESARQDIVASPPATTIPVFDTAIFDAVVFASESPVIIKEKCSQSMKAAAFYLEFEQEADDNAFQLYDMRLYGTFDKDRMT